MPVLRLAQTSSSAPVLVAAVASLVNGLVLLILRWASVADPESASGRLLWFVGYLPTMTAVALATAAALLRRRHRFFLGSAILYAGHVAVFLAWWVLVDAGALAALDVVAVLSPTLLTFAAVLFLLGMADTVTGSPVLTWSFLVLAVVTGITGLWLSFVDVGMLFTATQDLVMTALAGAARPLYWVQVLTQLGVAGALTVGYTRERDRESVPSGSPAADRS